MNPNLDDTGPPAEQLSIEQFVYQAIDIESKQRLARRALVPILRLQSTVLVQRK
jgi:hypothetical protein